MKQESQNKLTALGLTAICLAVIAITFFAGYKLGERDAFKPAYLQGYQFGKTCGGEESAKALDDYWKKYLVDADHAQYNSKTAAWELKNPQEMLVTQLITDKNSPTVEVEPMATPVPKHLQFKHTK